MAKADTLFQLISSLSSTEKRLFKMFVNTHSGGKDSSYLELFDAYSKLQDYSESALLRKLPKSYSVKNLAQQKKYLKDLILKAMREMDENRAEDTVNELMREHVFLGKKNLIKEQWKKLEKAKSIADKFELFSRSLEILDAQMSYLVERDFNKSIEFFEDYQAQRNDYLRNIQLYNSLVITKNKVFQLLRRFRKSIDAENLLLADNYVGKLQSDEILSRDSFKLKRVYYNILSNHADLHANKEEVLKNRHELVKLFDQYAWMIGKSKKMYLVTQFNYVSALFSNGHFGRMKETLDKLQQVKLSSDNDKGELFQNLTLYKILYWVNSGRLEDASSDQNAIEQGLKKYSNKINSSSMISIYFNYALVFFCNGNFDECINWLDKIDKVKKDVREDLKTFAKVLSVICHFELENYLLIESLVRSVRRSSNLIPIYANILSAVLSFSQTRSNGEKHWTKLKDEVDSSTKFVGRDVVQLWLDSKLSKQSIHKKYKESIQ